MSAWQSTTVNDLLTSLPTLRDINATLNGSVDGLKRTTMKHDHVSLSDDEVMKHMPEFLAAQYIELIYGPICAVLGILGNMVAFCVLVSARAKGSTTYVYMASLAVADTLVQVVNILLTVRKYPGHETLNEGTCGLVWLLLFLSLHYSVVVMVTMTVERYLAIRFPLKASLWFTLKRARVVVLLEALFIFGLNVQHVILRGMVYDGDAGQYVCMPIGELTTFYMFKVWPWIDGIIYCYLPFGCLLVFNLLILRQVRSSLSFQSKTVTVATTSGEKASTPQTTDKEARLISMLLLLTTAFLVCTFPMAVLLLVEKYYWFPSTPREMAQYRLAQVIIHNLSYTNHAINFFLYCFSGQRFRRELKQTFGCFFSGISG